MNTIKPVTLATLPAATAQEVFDHVANHLLTQDEPCMDDKNRCKYYFAGLKCAAGSLIHETEHRPEFDDCPLSWDGMIEKGWVPKDHAELIMELQIIHDQYKVSDWKKQLAALAKEQGLVWDTSLPHAP